MGLTPGSMGTVFCCSRPRRSTSPASTSLCSKPCCWCRGLPTAWKVAPNCTFQDHLSTSDRPVILGPSAFCLAHGLEGCAELHISGPSQEIKSASRSWAICMLSCPLPGRLCRTAHPDTSDQPVMIGPAACCLGSRLHVSLSLVALHLGCRLRCGTSIGGQLGWLHEHDCTPSLLIQYRPTSGRRDPVKQAKQG